MLGRQQMLANTHPPMQSMALPHLTTNLT